MGRGAISEASLHCNLRPTTMGNAIASHKAGMLEGPYIGYCREGVRVLAGFASPFGWV